MLSFELSDFMWARGRTEPISGVIRDVDGKTVDLTGSTLTMMAQQDAVVVEMACGYEADISVPSRACPAPSETYPNNDIIFGDAAFDFSAVLLPGAYVYFQKTGEIVIHSRQVHYVNEHYLTLFVELPDTVNATWNWWASDDSPTLAKRGKFQFTPNFSTMTDGPFDMQAKLVADTLVNYSAHLSCRIITPIQP